MKNRAAFQTGNVPVSVYEVYLGSFTAPEEGEPYANYRKIADKLIPYVKEMGYTHVELMPVMEHPLDASWGYQVIGYYAPTSRYGSPQDFMYFVNELHKAGIGVILDWVPAHFPRDVYGLSNFDGTCLYEHLDPRQGAHPHWGTLIYNYGRPEVSNYLIANALFWVEKFHADGIRMDAVASMLYLDYGKNDGEWVANIYGGNENLEAMEMIKHLNSMMKKRNPGVLTIAEESTAFPMITREPKDGGLGFDLKWNMGFMNDYLGYIRYDPYFRSHHHGELTFSMIYAYSERFMLVFSHDEVVHGKATLLGKMPGTTEQKFANLRLTYAYMMTHPGKKLLFMGQELGEFDEWNEGRLVEWELTAYPDHEGLSRLVSDLNGIYRSNPELFALDDSPEGFEWINHISAEQCTLTFVRKGREENEMLLIAANFSGIPLELTTGVPAAGKYKEIFNSDDEKYGGSGRVNSRVKRSKAVEWDDRPDSVTVKLAPLSLSILKYAPFTVEDVKGGERPRGKSEQEGNDMFKISPLTAVPMENIIEDFQQEIQEPGALKSFFQGLPEKALHLGGRVLLALLVFIIGVQLIRLIRKIVKKSMNRAGAETGAVQFVDSFIKAALYVLLVLMIAASFGLQAASIVAGLGSAGVAIGLAVQGSLSNLAGGVLILLLKPFRVGDYIVESSTGHEGTVTEIQIFYTRLLTADNKTVILPNGQLANNSIVNITSQKERRMDIVVGISYQADLKRAKEVLETVLREDEAVLKEKDMLVFVSDLGSSSVNLGVRCWFGQEDFWAGKWRVTENCKLALDAAGIEIPFNQLDVHVH